MSVTFKGIVPALITPMTPAEDVDEAGLRTLIERLIGAGVHALFVLGTNGEFIALSEEEKLRVATIAVDQAHGRVPVIAGTGAYATRDVIELNGKMQETGVDAVSVITPYFNGATQQELFAHYERIARGTSLPVMLYTIPAKAGITLNVDTVRRLSEIPNIRGIKDSGGDFDRLLQLINLRRDDFAVFTGTDSMILWTLIAGGDGAVAATTNAVPSVVMSIWNKFQSGDIESARQAQESLRALRDAFALGTMPVVLKTAAMMLGMPAGPARSPAQPLDDAARERLAKAIAVYPRVEQRSALTN
ncbi:4-hydroxy-tetrahydrodipicolinate synthase [Paraburkholderia rhynchosiae]|uniref:4-hydroxy-tetrahydrodipicolinate synthase n=1 Tax=Paraburkholderia rhynchosiae TaxID=487049 RepID=A0A2N7VLN2_9BURK|nr:4-hydroxy-tetrahydrodipicolinate synthase [Paraburkholderia rhynchosiae]PMS18046.1 4-hydroxy-tetrahydrodipicolinate synthase [Paraburkholderia rhynchosiae]CAB3744222.1 4-hydroxy-tetrahydrodipicolinate synthase [Paraburkholderia rhynchosiae]